MTLIDLATVICFTTPAFATISEAHAKHYGKLGYIIALPIAIATGLGCAWLYRRAVFALAKRERPDEPPFTAFKAFWWIMAASISMFAWSCLGAFAGVWLFAVAARSAL